MRFFHISDLHLGLKLINHDLIEDQEYILNQIVEAVKEYKPNAMVIAGDIYDKAIPSAEAVTLFSSFIDNLMDSTPGMAILAVSGNHDSGPRIDSYRNILERQNLYITGIPPMHEGEQIRKVTLTDEFGPVNFYLLPFVKPSMIKEITGQAEDGNNLSYDAALHRLFELNPVDESERNVLVSHQFYLPTGKNADEIERMDSEIRTAGDIDEVKSDVLTRYDYAALGHIHKPMKVGSDIFRYSGTPMPYSVDEAGQTKGVICVDIEEKGKVSTEVIRLIPRRNVRIVRGTLEEVLGKPSDDYVSVVLTDKVDLDVIDMQDRIRHSFPNLLEIRREVMQRADYSRMFIPERKLSPLELCCDFLGGADEEDTELLKDVINAVKGARG